MDYFEILNLTREPFSNSPDPDVFFYQSRQHVACLQKIEVEIRLCRGLNVVIGDVGTGKTTLCRRLIRDLASDDRLETHLILDPYFSTPLEFLSAVSTTFGLRHETPGNELTQWTYKEGIKNYLFERGIDAGVNVVLIIDEGQKLPWFCLEILREFLNYETNDKKLLQIIIFAQEEFKNSIRSLKNFSDRINMLHILGPLNFRDTRAMIRYRLELASSGAKKPDLFSFLFLWKIYRASGGYPRKIINLCHRAVLTMIVQNRRKAGWSLARFCIRSALPETRNSTRTFRPIAAGGVLLLLTIFILSVERLNLFQHSEPSGKVKSSRAGAIAERPRYPVPGNGLPATDTPASTRPESGLFPFSAYEGSRPDLWEAPSECPELLGCIDVPKGETLGSMIQAIYGVYNPEFVKIVMEHNPHMNDPDRLQPGMRIHFPAVRVPPPMSNLEGYLVQLSITDNISDAFRFFKHYQGKGLRLKIVPLWNPGSGLKFFILSRKLYREGKTARDAARRLHEEFGFAASLFKSRGNDTVFFASPEG